LNAGDVAGNWRPSTRSIVNLARSHVYHTERTCTFGVVQRVARVWFVPYLKIKDGGSRLIGNQNKPVSPEWFELDLF